MASLELFSGFLFASASAWLFLSQLLKLECFPEGFFFFLFSIEFSVSCFQ